jgi:hypothetical protein
MGNLVTRTGMHRHAYTAAARPAQVTINGVSAVIQHPDSGHTTMYPLSAPVATYAADGAPFYNSGYLPGYPSQALPGGLVALQLPPRAAMLDLTDRTSWDRPVIWPGAR